MKKFQKHACQHCGSEVKLVETIIDDEFSWNQESNSTNRTNLLTFSSILETKDAHHVNVGGQAYEEGA